MIAAATKFPEAVSFATRPGALQAGRRRRTQPRIPSVISDCSFHSLHSAFMGLDVPEPAVGPITAGNRPVRRRASRRSNPICAFSCAGSASAQRCRAWNIAGSTGQQKWFALRHFHPRPPVGTGSANITCPCLRPVGLRDHRTAPPGRIAHHRSLALLIELHDLFCELGGINAFSDHADGPFDNLLAVPR